MKSYKAFLKGKIALAKKTGFDISREDVHPLLFEHQKDVVVWNIKGGCRADFLSFGLGKTLIQLETCRQILINKGGKALIVCPLGVKHEFIRDGKKIDINDIRYITNSDQVTDDCDFYITNYERIRMGSIKPEVFKVVTMDEASILRGLSTDTVDVIMHSFNKIPYRFVCTATPSPNRFLELTHYADYLGIMDRGQILTRFFQRDSTTAGNLTLFPKREKEFWFWMSSWACFITKPSDLGYSDEGYELPPIKLKKHLVSFDRGVIMDKFDNQTKMFSDASKSLLDASREKRNSLDARMNKMSEIVEGDKDSHYILWHHLNAERDEIQKRLGKEDCKVVHGSMDYDKREDYVMGFSEGKYKYLATKPRISGSGCNFQYFCNKAIFVGIDYKFNDFIQAVHRVYRFMQTKQVEIHVIFTDAEDQIYTALEKKWSNHLLLQNQMTDIVKTHGLNSDLFQGDLKRQMFKKRREHIGVSFTAVNNDNVAEMKNVKENSIGLICSSIPFGNHYEYSDNYNCFGHNPSNDAFFDQMDYLTPQLYKALMPGRICAIHVKDRIRYGYQNGVGFTSIDPFSDKTNLHFIKHGFHQIGRITVTTDVVQENNQTYRLGWSEQCKDGSKMGVGLPEYILLFRKPPSSNDNAYADIKVEHTKEDYTRARWQLDAHSYWKSDGKRLFSSDDLSKNDLSSLLKKWKQLQHIEDYDFAEHDRICTELDAMGKLPTTYMAMPTISTNPDVWTDITRMQTLNTTQARRNLTKHICPLQLDLIARVIERYSNKGDVVLDPFGGIMSVPFQAIKMGRKGHGIELNPEYFDDGVMHCRNEENKAKQISLF